MNGTDYAAVHQDAFNRLTAFLGALDESDLAAQVPACPGWTVLDVTCHLTGLAVDLSGDSMPGPEDWAEEVMDRRHVDARRGMSVDEVLDEWRQAAPGFEKTLASVDVRMADAVVAEYACHEHDMRAALGRPGARTTLSTNVATDAFVRSFVGRADTAELPPIQVTADDRLWGAADEQAVVKLAGQPFEIFRAVTGRRTVEEIQGLGWQGDPDPYIAVISAFGIPDKPLGE